MNSGSRTADRTGAPALRLRIGESLEEARSYRFNLPFVIGRDDACEVSIRHDYVSRRHAQAVFENGMWWVRDLGSANGIFVRGRRVESAPVEGELTLRLGAGGPYAWIEVETAAAPAEPPAAQTVPDPLAEAAARYFGDAAGDQPMSDRTVMIRRAYEQVQEKQRWKLRWIFAVLAVLLLASGAYSLYNTRQWNQRQELARALFYAMKSTELEVAQVERMLLDSHNPQTQELVRSYRERERQNEQRYDDFLKASNLYAQKLPEREKLLLRVTRIFGECELTMPPEYVDEVNKYIGYWQSTGRLKRGITLAQSKGYASRIGRDFLSQGLPPQYFYLALQESGFDPYASGPPTYKGIAKGMWQFIPETGGKYGLKIGPLQDLPRPDPGDDRHNWEKATGAAAHYIKDLYTTDAQASGLLVIACYNWGEDRVLPLVRGMPRNPRERNFWRLLRDYKDRIPKETYDYVFYIVSAAVIGENPRLFGFDFDPPLANLDGLK